MFLDLGQMVIARPCKNRAVSKAASAVGNQTSSAQIFRQDLPDASK